MDTLSDTDIKLLAGVLIVGGIVYAFNQTSGGISAVGTAISGAASTALNDITQAPAAVVSALNNPAANPFAAPVTSIMNFIDPPPSAASSTDATTAAAGSFFGLTPSGASTSW